MKMNLKLLFIVFNSILAILLLNTMVYAESEDYNDDVILKDTIEVSCYDSKTKNIDIKEYDFSSIPKEYPDENREPTIEVAHPFWVVGPDDREYLNNMTTYPNRTICFIYVQNYKNENPYVGTGVMIGRNTVLTSAHLLYDYDRAGCQEYEKWAANVKVVPACWGGYAPTPKNMPYNSAMMEKMWVPTDYQTSGNSNYDWGVIKLNENKGNETGFCDLEANDNSSELKNVNIVSKGYPNPTGNGIVSPYKSFGKILNAYGMRFYTDMDIEKGQSGSPVFKAGSETNVIGIISGEDKYNTERNAVTKINSSVKTAIFQIRAEAQQ